VARVLAVLILGGTVLVAAFPGWFVHYQPLALHPERVLQGPGEASVLGTDQYGRSLVGLLVYGARNSVLIGLVSVVVGLLIGGGIGLVAGFVGGVVDNVLMRIVDIMLCFPGILLALLVSAALGASLRNVIIAVAIGQVPEYARVMRGQVLAVRSRLFVEAASAAGVHPRRIVFRHVLPNAMAPVMVVATLGVGHAIVSGATLSFLGVGPQGGIPDWGRLLASGGSYMATAWWISTFPGLVVTVVVVAVNIFGDWLRDRMDVAR
jgi:peptide/nickel transport system permease protein